MNRIDARRVAAEGRELSGTIALSTWPRAADSVVDPSVEVDYRIIGGFDDHGRPQLRVAVTGSVEVTCQRCLQPMMLQIGEGIQNGSGIAGDGTNILLAADDEELEVWDSEVEDAEVVLADQPLDINELLEDEFLLSLPFSPMCDDLDCPKRKSGKQVEAIDVIHVEDAGSAADAGKNNPFATLRGKLGSTQD